MKETYVITDYTRKKAQKLGVTVRLSKNPAKKIDVFRDGKLLASVGGRGYGDYPTFMKTHGVPYARRRRELYKLRHESDRHAKNSPGYWADQLLW
jgi:hypothetical protein